MDRRNRKNYRPEERMSPNTVFSTILAETGGHR